MVQGSPGSRYHPRHHSTTRHHMGTNYYNRTKRKRDSSSCSNGHHGVQSCQDQGGPVVPLPPWSDPDYPYSRGIIGGVHTTESQSPRVHSNVFSFLCSVKMNPIQMWTPVTASDWEVYLIQTFGVLDVISPHCHTGSRVAWRVITYHQQLLPLFTSIPNIYFVEIEW